MSWITYLCLYTGCIDVKLVSEDDQGRSKHVGVMKIVYKNIILTLV